jgi:hypothetical protein
MHLKASFKKLARSSIFFYGQLTRVLGFDQLFTADSPDVCRLEKSKPSASGANLQDLVETAHLDDFQDRCLG